jgi:hypothetical protein
VLPTDSTAGFRGDDDGARRLTASSGDGTRPESPRGCCEARERAQNTPECSSPPRVAPGVLHDGGKATDGRRVRGSGDGGARVLKAAARRRAARGRAAPLNRRRGRPGERDHGGHNMDTESGSNPSSTPARSAGAAGGTTGGSRPSAATRGEREAGRAGPEAGWAVRARVREAGLPALAAETREKIEGG